MKNTRLDISPRRFHPLWMILGVVIGAALGHLGAMNFAFWYFASPSAIVLWKIFAAVACALFASFLMTSDAPPRLKGAILGMGIAFAVVFYCGELWSVLQTGRSPAGLAGMSVAEGIFFEWLIIHATLLGLIAGWIVGAVVSRGRRDAGKGD